MREDFCAFILTHGRPGNVRTYQTLQTAGYTGKVFIVIDDEDETAEEYKRIYGDAVLVFSKDEVGRYTDQFDNFSDRRAVVWARNACWDLARNLGYRFFIQLDDDYNSWQYRGMWSGRYAGWNIKTLDTVFEAMVRLIETTTIKTVALSQGGDHIGGEPTKLYRRKAMNSFVCGTEKPFLFRGRLNDDVNTYVSLGRTGDLFVTYMPLQITQPSTQSSSGGMSELYRDSGTYVKAFYTVMAAPSCTIIKPLHNHRATGPRNPRLHHKIDWRRAVPLILRQ